MHTEQSTRGVSVIIPLCNGETTIEKTLDSLDIQKFDSPIEILIIDDRSTDNSLTIAQSHPIAKRIPIRIVQNTLGGLANGYNFGAQNAKYEYLIIQHQDCYVTCPTAIRDLVAYFDDPSVVGVMSRCYLPKETWQTMSFWDRVAHSRYIGSKPIHGFGGKFDGLRKSALIKIGGFDATHFFSAAEDSDIGIRLTAIGRLAPSQITVVHAHHYPANTKLRSLFRKQQQLGEGFGALLRKHISILVNPALRGLIITHTTKLVILLCILIPPLTVPALILFFVLGCFYAWRACLTPDIRVLLVPFVSMLLMATFCLSMIKGFIQGCQSFDYAIRKK